MKSAPGFCTLDKFLYLMFHIFYSVVLHIQVEFPTMHKAIFMLLHVAATHCSYHLGATILQRYKQRIVILWLSDDSYKEYQNYAGAYKFVLCSSWKQILYVEDNSMVTASLSPQHGVSSGC